VTSNSRLPVSALIPDTIAIIYRAQTARDPVLVVECKGGALISYLREDGTLVHTLNTSEGFHRKLRKLGVEIEVGTIGS
jgi:predicted methyltransferase